ncbi:2-iminoacetate synthase ThiH [Caldanaerobius polysaccharolyticus]|uniref:2-iminoacetate synthase ThiH n=1 Tax=Caldanaerobius polysaccharolyticus TaxID=44256 RepID=UPI000B040C35|nr:2-iminoacetate synthase ThiH [Caldanaerobius polysaccharolyticus]
MIEETIEEAEGIYQNVIEHSLTKDEVINILLKDHISREDALKLMLFDDDEVLELMAKKAKELTDMYFGKSILLYTPLYISNYCNGGCVYCGYSSLKRGVKRQRLDYEQIEAELRAIKEKGFDSIIILTGEDREKSSVDYIGKAVELACNMFSEVIAEVYAMTYEEYRELVKRGLTGITIFQETYNRGLYEKLHLRGQKKDYSFRINAPERAIMAGVRQVSIGALLGLDVPVKDMFMTLLHGEYLMNQYPDVEVSICLPRLRPAGVNLKGFYHLDDKNFVRFILTTRLFLKRAGINISTRESSYLRDNLIGLGVTKMSAGSKTTVGGYAQDSEERGQFDVNDSRDVNEIVDAIRKRGYRPEFINWVRGLV